MMALTAWRENRSGGRAGMQSVINVIQNRAAKSGETPYSVCTHPEAFSSITALGDHQASLWPKETDQTWIDAQLLASDADDAKLPDITNGSTLYYAPAGLTNYQMVEINGEQQRFPAGWNFAAVEYQATIANQLFFREV